MIRALFLETGTPVPAESWDRVYLGSEACPWLLPSPAELEKRLAEAASLGLPVTLATPWLPPRNLPGALELVEALNDREGAEVVANDWGLLHAAAGRRLGLSLGRLLVKGYAGSERRPPAPGLFSSPGFVDLVRGMGVNRVELDALTVGAGPSAAAAGLAVSLHQPLAFVTVAGRCPWRFDGLRWEEGPCPRPCLGRDFDLVRREDGFRVTMAGRAQFVSLPAPAGPETRGADRVVTRRGVKA